uniref:Uncharacterized protein n=1 Tax=Glossina pallidipes TaxID=7398 RepID=A0A1B0A5I0_GLOPL
MKRSSGILRMRSTMTFKSGIREAPVFIVISRQVAHLAKLKGYTTWLIESVRLNSKKNEVFSLGLVNSGRRCVDDVPFVPPNDRDSHHYVLNHPCDDGDDVVSSLLFDKRNKIKESRVKSFEKELFKNVRLRNNRLPFIQASDTTISEFSRMP